jgi:hypothetical protein
MDTDQTDEHRCFYMVFEKFIRSAGLAVGLMEIEN